MLFSFLGGLWGRVVAVVVAVASVVGALATIRYRIRKGAKADMSAEMRQRTIERLEQVKDVQDDIGRLDDAGVAQWLSEHGYFRD